MENIERIVLNGYYVKGDNEGVIYNHNNLTLELYEKGLDTFYDKYDEERYTFEGVIFEEDNDIPLLEVYSDMTDEVFYNKISGYVK